MALHSGFEALHAKLFQSEGLTNLPVVEDSLTIFHTMKATIVLSSERKAAAEWEQETSAAHLASAISMRSHLEKIDGLHKSSVRDIDWWLALVLQVIPQACQQINDRLWQLH